MQIDLETIYYALIITFFAWLSTSIWAIIAFFFKKESYTFLSFWLWFSAWVMIYLSFIEIIPESLSFFENYFVSEVPAWVWSLIFLSVWILFMIFVDYILWEKFNPDEPNFLEWVINKNNLFKVGVLTAVALSLHNIPEWLATFVSWVVSIEVGFAIAIALALHNIPEWMSVALPIYYATGSKLKSFIYASLAWMFNLIWAIFWIIFVYYFYSEFIMWAMFSFVAWIMLFVSFHQLLPTAAVYKKHHSEVFWVLFWMLSVWFIMLFL